MSLADKPLILMVDDTPANLSVLFDLLSAQDFEISVAEDGESALEQMGYICPDLILLDVLMPRMDGFTTCRRIKERAETRDIPIIFMTSLMDTVDKVTGFAAGAVDYITKPFQQEEVLARIKTHLALHALKARLAESEERLSRIVETAMDAIITFDRKARVLLFNQAAERVFRCPAAEALGTDAKRFCTDSLYRLVADYLDEGRIQAPMWVPEGQCALRADGEPFPVEATLSCTEVNGQALYTAILRDVQERQRAKAERQRLEGLTLYLQEEIRGSAPTADPIGAAHGLREIMRSVERVAGTDATVLILGETGTGKEVIARAVHAGSKRKERVMVKLNCAAIPKDLVESELFGHEKGAFTGALTRKLGRFELADQGTLFLDELGELPLDLQAKLLRVLQEGELERVGSSQTLKVDVRIIAATNRDLARRVRDGHFRADLYYRLNVFPIALPPLRERKEDLPLLVRHFVETCAGKYGKRIDTVSEHAMAALLDHGWPGNVRELQHVIERAVILTRGSELAFAPEFLGDESPRPRAGIDTLEAAERAHILKALEHTAWRVSGAGGAADLLGVPPSTLESRMKKLGITRPA